MKPVLDAAAARLRQLNPISCAASNRDAVDGLAPIIVTALNAWFRSIKDDWDVRQNSLDNSGADRCAIDCSKCDKRKISFRGVTLDCTIRVPPNCTFREGQKISGNACGDPVEGNWKITAIGFAEGCGVSYSDPPGDKPFDDNCVWTGSEEETQAEAIYKNAQGMGGGGWMCVYSDNPRPQITIRSFRPPICIGNAEQKITVDAEVGENCDESSQPLAPPSPPRLPPNS